MNGRVRIELPEHFGLVTGDEGLTVQVTAHGPSRGLYVAARTATYIEVAENNGGTGDVVFDWIVNGVRKGYEDHEVITDDPVLMKALDDGDRFAAEALEPFARINV